MIYVRGKTSIKPALIHFQKIRIQSEDYTVFQRSSAADKLGFTCTSTPDTGDFQIRIRGGQYLVRIQDVPACLIEVPIEAGVYELDSLVLFEIPDEAREPVTRGGTRMIGPLTLHASPDEDSDGMQAATKEFVEQSILTSGEIVHHQFSPVNYFKFKHGKKRRPPFKLTRLDGKTFEAPHKYPDEDHLELFFNSARTFVLYV